jgi:hypothetical protein
MLSGLSRASRAFPPGGGPCGVVLGAPRTGTSPGGTREFRTAGFSKSWWFDGVTRVVGRDGISAGVFGAMSLWILFQGRCLGRFVFLVLVTGDNRWCCFASCVEGKIFRGFSGMGRGDGIAKGDSTWKWGSGRLIVRSSWRSLQPPRSASCSWDCLAASSLLTDNRRT